MQPSEPDFSALAWAEIRQSTSGRLPHWEADGAIYYVTFRLADSLPREVVEAYQAERRAIIHHLSKDGPLTPEVSSRMLALFNERMDNLLDAGAGSCALRHPRMAECVSGAIRHFDGSRYALHAWTVMPNHVHVVFELADGESLPNVLHSWKSFTSHQAPRLIGWTGTFWQQEYFDHLIRSVREYRSVIRYVAQNPTKAKLGNWQHVWAIDIGEDW